MRVKRARVLTSFILAWVDGETGLRARAHLHIETIAYRSALRLLPFRFTFTYALFTALVGPGTRGSIIGADLPVPVCPGVSFCDVNFGCWGRIAYVSAVSLLQSTKLQ